MESLARPDLLWLIQALLVALFTGLVGALVVGVLLLARPERMLGVNNRLSRWIDTRATLEALDQPRTIERFFYRHHRVLGTVLTLGAGYVLWVWAFEYERAQFLAAVHRSWTQSFDWLVAGLEWAVVLLHAAILVLGLVILVRPSLLKNVEKVANRWHGGAAGADALDETFNYLERCFEAFPRLSGVIVLLAAAWSLFALIPFVIQALSR